MSKPASNPNSGTETKTPMEELEIGSALYTTQLTSKFRNRKKWERPDEMKLIAVIPGTIQKLFVKEGADVVQGTPVLILEAMKMRNVIVSNVSGVVKKIYVSEGEQVPKDFLLVDFE